MKIVSIVGARPQFVKAAMVSRSLRGTLGIEELLLHTGQHYDFQMSQVFFDDLDIPAPSLNLEIGSGTHGEQTGRMLMAIERVLAEVIPDGVLVYGDTNSTLAGALAAVKLHIPVFHVEAGLRSFNRKMPEEINRVLTDHASDLLFAPTALASDNLRREGFSSASVHHVGDVMYDAAKYYGEKADERSRILEALNLQPANYVLATIHRAENTDDPERMAVILGTLQRVRHLFPVVVPLHPRTRRILDQSPLHHEVLNLRIIDPVGYLDMIKLEKNARLIITDSGGVQKESFFYGVACVTARDETEWVELVELGWNRLAPPTSVESQLRQIESALESSPVRGHEPYGRGDAASKIVGVIAERGPLKSARPTAMMVS